MNTLKKLFLFSSVALCSALLTACSSTGKPASASFASVVIQNRSLSEIASATTAVFQTEGYTRYGGAADGEMTFEREASKGKQMAYSGLGGSYYDEAVNERIRAEIVSLGADSYRLQCKAYIIRSADSAFHQEEVPLSNLRSRPYQKLLNQVAERLK